MSKDLTQSSLDRKNILNNHIALQEVYEQVGYYGILFEEKYRFTKQQVARYFEVDIRTIDRLLENHKDELEQSGYELFTGSRLKRYKEQVSDFVRLRKKTMDVHDTNVVITNQLSDNELDSILKSPQLSVFTYKAFLNVGMLLTSSERAQILRSLILDIVIDVLNKKLGGKTKFINQREEEFLPSAIREYSYRKAFTDALQSYIADNKFKYSQITDKIYKSIFEENAKEYRQILKLNARDSVRSTMYSEVLDLIAGYENGYAQHLKKEYDILNRKLSLPEALELYRQFELLMDATLTPLREKARSLMASRDLAFRDALHEKLQEYIAEVTPEDYDRFLGAQSMDLEKRLEENKDVFIRLKDR
jgi:hypothetical protein